MTKRPPDTIVYVTPAQAEAVRGSERRATGRTITEIVLSAVGQPPPTGRCLASPSTGTAKGRLFQGSVAAKPEDDGLGKVQPEDDPVGSAALDKLAADVNAPSRSHLIRKALSLVE